MPTQTFDTVGTHTFDVPDGIDFLDIDAWGGEGGDGDDGLTTRSGGQGGHAFGTLAVTPGETVTVVVGGQGSKPAGGFNGGAGGESVFDGPVAGGGGGASDVRQDGSDLADRVLIGGGGGGSGTRNTGDGANGGAGGAGGYPDGLDGDGGNQASSDGGDGGTQSSGGSGSGNAADGSLGAGGAGESGNSSAGGGGGGGLYGGGGGAGRGSGNGGGDGAGGGSSGYDSGVVSQFTSDDGARSGDGRVEIFYRGDITDLSASGDIEDEIALSWSGVNWANGIRILRAEASGSVAGDYSEIADISGGATSYTDAGREDGERYYYRVEPYDAVTSRLSNEADATTELPEPSITSITETASSELTIEWSGNDDSPDGSFAVYRSTADGSLGTEVYSSTDLSTTSYADSVPDSSETYYYTVRRETDHATADSTQQVAGVLVAPSDISSTASGDDVTVSWSDETSNEDGFRVLWREADATEWSGVSADLAPNTESHTIENLLDGEQYEFTVEVFVGTTAKRPLREA